MNARWRWQKIRTYLQYEITLNWASFHIWVRLGLVEYVLDKRFSWGSIAHKWSLILRNRWYHCMINVDAVPPCGTCATHDQAKENPSKCSIFRFIDTLKRSESPFWNCTGCTHHVFDILKAVLVAVYKWTLSSAILDSELFLTLVYSATRPHRDASSYRFKYLLVCDLTTLTSHKHS